ncbi:MAG: ATP-binding protein [Negativicutes bacterium]|nr:ATP-binding protein [Negativicutes bacterium]
MQQPTEGSRRQDSIRRLSGYSWLVILLGSFLIGGLCLFVQQQVQYDYDRTIEEASQETTNLAIAFEEHVRRIIADVDKDLLSLKQAYERDGISSPVIAENLASTGKDPALVQEAIINKRGILIASYSQDILGVNVLDRDYFQIPRDSLPEGLYIGKPIRTKTLGRSVIPVSRRINQPDGSFAGVIYISLNPDYFSAFYNKMNLGQHQRISLIGLDWIVRAHQSGDNSDSGQNIYGRTLWNNVQNGRVAGTYVSTDILDGISRLVSYRVMPDYPLIVSVGKATQVALAAYEKRKRLYILGTLLFSLVIMIVCGLLVRRTRQIIDDSEKRYESLLAGMPDAFVYGKMIYENDRPEDFIHLAVNDVFKKITGIRDITGKKITEILPGIKEENPELLQVCGRVSATGQSERFEMYIKPLNTWLGNTVFSNQKGYFLAIFNDITERKAMAMELEEHRHNLQTLVAERTEELEGTVLELQKASVKLIEQAQLLELAKDYIIVSDMDSNITYWNRGAESGYGWLASEAIGQVTLSLLKTQFPPSVTVKHVLDRLRSEGRWEGELTHTRKDGKQIVVQSYLTLNRDAAGNPVSILEINHDITKQKNMEIDLARLDRLNTVGEMAAGIGHEVRNPLTTVRGFLQHYGRKAAFAEYREPFELMIEELDRANSIITEFLSLAKNKTVTMSSTDLNQIIQSLVPLLQSNALLKGNDIELKLGDIPKVWADDKEIRQCILNLVGNGLDASPRGGKVTISTARAENKVVLTVRDTGPGIPPEIRDKLGTPFLTTKEKGSGLGLAVCYRIAQRHQAVIEVETGPAGTAFHFIFNENITAE